MEANVDLIGSAMCKRVAHGFLRDPDEMGLGFVAKPWIVAARRELAADAASVADVARQDLEP
jgi:hypothetical protein